MISAIVPAKKLQYAKRRLSPILSEKERRQLSLCMLEDVVSALTAVQSVDEVAVVSADTEILSLAERLGCNPIAEPAHIQGLNAALAHAVQCTTSAKQKAVLVLPADLPMAAPTEINTLLEALPLKKGVVICPSQGNGTNAIALRPPQVIPFRFGPGSFEAHRREAEKRKLPLQIMSLPSLANDIDGPQDIVDLLTNPRWTEKRALSTYHFLSSILINSRMAAALGASSCLGGW